MTMLKYLQVQEFNMFKVSKEEKALVKKYKAAKTAEEKEAIHLQIKKLRGEV